MRRRPDCTTLIVFILLLLLSVDISLALVATIKMKGNVAVVGCGVLGTSLCKQLLEEPAFENVQITGITKSTTRHDDIRNQVGSNDDDRFHLSTMDDILQQKVTFRHVVFCAPPSGFDDYPAAIEECIEKLWDNENDKDDDSSTFVFTSSGGIYGGGISSDVEIVTEQSPVADPSTAPRIERLIKAEHIVRNHDGCVLRLAGLYTATRGAHGFWFGSGKPIRGRPDGIINLLHYDDAAGACLAALKAGKKSEEIAGATFLVSDGNPLSRKGICESAMKSTLFRDKTMPDFADQGSNDGPMGKIYDGSVTNTALDWKPRYESFDAFMREQ